MGVRTKRPRNGKTRSTYATGSFDPITSRARETDGDESCHVVKHVQVIILRWDVKYPVY